MRKRINSAAVSIILTLVFSVTAVSAFFVLMSFPNAKLVFSGIDLECADDGSVQGYVDLNLKYIDATGVAFCICYDTDWLKLSNAEDNSAIVNNTTDGTSSYNSEHTYFVQNTDLFPDGCFMDLTYLKTTSLGIADADSGYLMMNFMPWDDSGDGISVDDAGNTVISANSAEGVNLGKLSFQILDPSAFSKLTSDELSEIIQITTFSTVNSEYSTSLEQTGEEDTGVYLMYYDSDDDIFKYYTSSEYYIESEWEIEVGIADVVPQVESAEVSAYEIYNNGTVDDLFDYLNREMSVMTLQYADGTSSLAKMVWDSETAEVTGTWNPQGGAYEITQAYNDKFSVTVTVTVTPVTLAGLYADNDDLTYVIGDDDFPTTFAELDLPSSVHTVLSPYIPNAGTGDIEISWYYLLGTYSQITDLPDGFGESAAEYTFCGVIASSGFADEYPWLTVGDIDDYIEIKRTVVDAGTTVPKELSITSSTVDSDGTWTITAAYSDDSDFDGSTEFSIRLPDGTILDTTADGITYSVDLTTDSTAPVITITANSDAGDYAAQVAKMLNLGSRGGSFEIAAVVGGYTGAYTDCTPDPRKNEYTASMEFDYSGDNAGVFNIAEGETLSTTLTLPLPTDTVPTLYDGTDGSEPGALNTITVAEWIVTDTDADTGVVTVKGTLADAVYTNYGNVSNSGGYSVTIKYIPSGDASGTKTITDIPDFIFNTQKVGYGYDDLQTEEFTIQNLGTDTIYGLYVEISYASDEEGNMTEAFTLRRDISAILESGESASFDIMTKHGLDIGTYTADVTIYAASASGDTALDTFTVKFTVTDKDVYKITIETTEDGAYGTAETSDKLYTYPEGDTVTVIAAPEEDCEFTGWTADDDDVEFLDASQETTSFTMPSRDVTITANFAETTGAYLRCTDLKVMDGSSECSLYDTDWTLTSFTGATREYNVAVPNTTESIAVWFIPREELASGMTITVTDKDGEEINYELDEDDYYKTGAVALEVSPTVNTVTVTMTYNDPDDDPDEGDVTRTYTLNIYRKLTDSATASFDYGNSPYGLIMKDDAISADNKSTAKTEFVTNGHRFEAGGDNTPENGKTNIDYNTDAWSGMNYDCDDVAMFVYGGGTIEETCTGITNTLGEAVSDDDITVTLTVNNLPTVVNDGNLISDFKNTTEQEITYSYGDEPTLGTRIRPDVYYVKYTYKDFDGTTVTVQRPLIILAQLGDVDVDGTVDETDSELIINRYDTVLPNSSDVSDYTGADLYLYRVCDANKNGHINALDANYIRQDEAKRDAYY